MPEQLSDRDDDQTLAPLPGGKDLLANPRSTSRSSRGSTKSAIGMPTPQKPLFETHTRGFESAEFRMISNSLLDVLFMDPANREKLEQIQEKYHFESKIELLNMMTETVQRAAETKLATAIEDPRKSYKKKVDITVSNSADNPFCVD